MYHSYRMDCGTCVPSLSLCADRFGLVWFGLTQIFTWNCYQIQLFSCLAFRGMYVWCLPACVRPCCECLMRGTITLTGKSLMLHIDKFSSLFSFFTLSTHCAEIYRKYQYLRLLRFNYFVWNRVMLFFIHTHTYMYIRLFLKCISCFAFNL